MERSIPPYFPALPTLPHRPLHIAAGHGDDTLLRVLLEEGANKDAVTTDGFSALHCAAAKGALPCVALLLEIGVDANLKSGGPESRTPLHAAAVRGDPDIVGELLRCGAQVDVTDSDLTTALHIAAANGNLEVARCVIEAGANVNVTNVEGDTPLHLACMMLNHRVAKLLLSREADETAVNKYNSTPADVLKGYLMEDGRGHGNPTLVNMISWMLARAPADRAWRRKSGIVMMRGQFTRQWAAGKGGDDERVTETGDALSSVMGKAGRECGQRRQCWGNIGGDAEAVAGGHWSLWLRSAVEISEEGIFRTIVSFV